MGQFRSQRAHLLVGTSQRNCAMKGFPRTTTTTTKTHKRNYLPTYLPYYARDEVRTKTLTTTTNNNSTVTPNNNKKNNNKMKKYFKEQVHKPRDHLLPERPLRERDDRLDCNKIKTTLNANADFASFLIWS